MNTNTLRSLIVVILLPLVFTTNARAANTCNTVPPPNPGGWVGHACGKGVGHCSPSVVPPPAPIGSASPLPTAADFDEIANPMAACCGMGWGEDTDSASKLDCVEAVAPIAPTYKSFLTFYKEGEDSDKIKTAKVTFPNKMFVLGRDGIPLNGFYDQGGRRCNYRNPTTKEAIRLTKDQQMALFDEALSNDKVPNPSAVSGIPPVEVDPLCCSLIIFALERRCPKEDTIGGINVATTVTWAGSTTRRCIAAKEMKLNFGIIDLCDPKVVKRGRFRIATSYLGQDPKLATIALNSPISVANLVSEFYPKPSPLPSPTPAPPNCPSSAFYEVPWTNGLCQLKAPEPPPSPTP